MTDYNLDVLIQMILDRSEKNKVVQGLDDVEKNTKDVEKATKAATKESTLMARTISKNARLMARELNELKETAGFIKRGAMPLFQLGIAGFAAIALSAKKYIDNTKESNEVTVRWAAATQKISDAQMRIGKISAEAILPLLEKAATIAEKTAAFVEKHPGIIEGGLKASIVAAGLGGIGLLVSKGITLYADIKMIAVGDMQLTAARLMAKAANEQLMAATGKTIPGAGTAAAAGTAKAAGTATAATATVGGVGIGAIVATTLSVLAGLGVGLWAYDQIAKATGMTRLNVIATGGAKVAGDVIGKASGLDQKEADRKALVFMAIVGKLTHAIDESSPIWMAAKASVDQHNQAVAASAAVNTAAAAAQSDNAMQALKSADANKQAANSAYMAASATTSASNGLRQIPSALSGLGTSIGNFFSNIIASLMGRGSAPTHDYTGYAYKGMYAMAQNNQRQFVMSGQATRLAEQMLGGQLNQQAMLGALGAGRGGITINDASTYHAGVGARDRRTMRQERLREYDAIFKENPQ